MNNQDKDYCPIDKKEQSSETEINNISLEDQKGAKKWTVVLIIVVFVLLSISTILMYLIFFNKNQVQTTNEPVVKDKPQAKITKAPDPLDDLKQEIENEEIASFEADLNSLEKEINSL